MQPPRRRPAVAPEKKIRRPFDGFGVHHRPLDRQLRTSNWTIGTGAAIDENTTPNPDGKACGLRSATSEGR